VLTTDAIKDIYFSMQSILLALCLPAFLSITTHAEFAHRPFYLSVDKSKVIHQEARACIPTSIFNSFVLGNAKLQQAVTSLPGTILEDKYHYVLASIGQKPSETQANGKPRYSPDVGMDFDDAPYFAADLLNETNYFTLDHAAPRAHESAREYAVRIHDEFFLSLESGVPPVILIMANEDGKDINFGHAVTVTGVSQVSEDNGFTLELVDPIDLEHELNVKVLDDANFRMAQVRFVQEQSSDGIVREHKQILRIKAIMARLSEK